MFLSFVLHESERAARGDIWRAIRAGRFPAQRKDDGGFKIDPAELSRVFEPQRPDERVGDAYVASLSDGTGCFGGSRRRSTMGLPGMAGALFAEDFIAPYRCDSRSLARKSDGGPNRNSKTVLRPLA